MLRAREAEYKEKCARERAHDRAMTEGRSGTGLTHGSKEDGEDEAFAGLLAAGVDVEELATSGHHPGCTALEAPMYYNYDDIFQLLLSRGADPNRTAQGGEYDCHPMPLMVCARHGKASQAKLLLAAGADKDLLSPPFGDSWHGMETRRAVVCNGRGSRSSAANDDPNIAL